MGGRSGELHPASGPVPGKTPVEQEHHLHGAPPPVPQNQVRRLPGNSRKGAAANEEATVTPRVTREEVLKAQGEELSRQAGGVSPFLTAFFSGRRLTQKEAEELKQLIDQHTWEG